MTEFALEPLHPLAILNRLRQTPFPPVVDSTMLSSYSCPQKFFLEYILHLAPEAKSGHLIAGGACASAFQAIRHAYFFQEADEETALGEGWRAFQLAWGDYDMEGVGAKSFINTWAAVESYFDEYPLAKDYLRPVRKPDGTPAIEYTFAIPTEIKSPTTGDPILYGGRFDMLAQRDNSHVVVDEKTTSSIMGNWAKQWQMRGQFLGYVFAAQMNGFQCNEAVVRGIAIQKTQIKHAEVPILYSNHQLEHWWTNLFHTLREMTNRYEAMQTIIDSALHQQHDPEATLARVHQCWSYDFGEICGSYGGCHFIPLCSRKEPWEWYTDYAHRIWNPLERDPTAGSQDKREMQHPSGEGLTLEDFKK